MENSCKKCERSDDEEMVQCDSCDEWFHYSCVDVGNEVEDQDWSCSTCLKAQDLDKTVVHQSTLTSPNHIGTNELQPSGNKKKPQSTPKAASIRSSVIFSGKAKIDLELRRLEEERSLKQQCLKQQLQLDKQYLKKKYEILAQGEEEPQDDESVNAVKINNMRTEEWLKNIDPPASKQPLYKMQELSGNQLSARSFLNKDLPIFSGRPEEWPMFISAFENSTSACGFSDTENLVRLQRSLRGKALESVRSLLLMPATVTEAIKTLRLLYGRPEYIINSLINEVRKAPIPKLDKLDTLINYAIIVKNLCATIKASNLQGHFNNPLLRQELVEKLPSTIKLNWAMYSSHNEEVDIEAFSIWLYDLAIATTAVSSSHLISDQITKDRRTTSFAPKGMNTHQQSNNEVDLCCVCKRDHEVKNCQQFLALSLKEKWSMIRKLKICKCCLKKHHFSKCQLNKRCSIEGCQAKHNPILHDSTNNWSTIVPSTPTVGCHELRHQKTKSPLFRIVPVLVYGDGVTLNIFALLDEGSSVTLMDKRLVKRLNLNGVREELCLKWTGDTTKLEPDSQRVSLKLSSTKQDSRLYTIHNVRTVGNLNLPKQTLLRDEIIKDYTYLKDVPFESYKEVTPLLLIGIDNGKLGLPLKTIERKWTEPIATKTRLGWVIGGGCNSRKSDNSSVYHSYEACKCCKELHQIVQEYLEINQTQPLDSSYASKEEKVAIELLKDTTKPSNGRYESGLLWRSYDFSLPDSYGMALKRLQCLEKRSRQEPALLIKLNEQIDELVNKGYARKLSLVEQNNVHKRIWYLPVFIVRNPNKPNKVRLVWDAAATVKGISLNTLLYKGPDQVTPLINVLLRFRERKVAVCGDIKEMFHQIQVKEDDQHMQRFLWRRGEVCRIPDIYVMQVLTFGASCSPSIAQYIKNVNAQTFSKQYPQATEAIIECHYVDDFLISVDTAEEAIRLSNEIKFIHSKAGFIIHNWLSNDPKVLQELANTSKGNKAFQESTVIQTDKILGLWWLTSEDKFTFVKKYTKVDPAVLNGTRMPTKRELLQMLMSVFDPLGFLAHYLVRLKIILQGVWRTSVEWDETIPLHLQKKWQQWLQILPTIEDVRIPRCYSALIHSVNTWEIELHTFVDASQEAMSAVAYLRVSEGTNITVTLVGAKTKVAPKKPMSIPRLELQAAIIGARWADIVCKGQKLNINGRVFWSDSKTVLCWLRSEAKQYKPFVMYRVGEILELTKEKEWRWISTKENVADEATKWQKSPVIRDDSRWFSGPKFLKQPKEDWPKESSEGIDYSDQELRPSYVMITKEENLNIVNFERFSKWSRLLRTLAWVCRYFTNLKLKSQKASILSSELSSQELKQAQGKLIRLVQKQSYGNEMLLLKQNKPLPNSSKIAKYSPYVDNDGVMKMKGRLDNAPFVDTCVKRPIILPKESRVTYLIVHSYHEKFHHCSYETVINEVRQNYWIPSLRRLVKSIRHNCNRCKINRAKPECPEMAPLPLERVTAFSRPFTYVGVDYFGPVNVTVGRRTEKRWGVLFTCLAIRAVHLEIAYSLSTDSCIMAIRNFIARRGTPKIFYSDNGTNFKGAESELHEAFKNINKSSFEQSFNTVETEWKFIPPSSPHMGGSWERLVGAVKKVLYHICQHQQRFQDENLRCFLMEVEAIINARPLTHVSLEISDSEALTPNHFLLGSSDGSKLPGEFNPDDLFLRKGWRMSQQLANVFWKRWLFEYLPTLTRRGKWFQQTRNLQIGDVVIIADGTLPRNTWPKGIVVDVVRSQDGQVRRATVKTMKGIYVRPAVKLAVLDVRSEDESSSRLTEGECDEQSRPMVEINKNEKELVGQSSE